MTKKWLKFVLIVVLCGLVSSFVTRWFVLVSIGPDCDGVTDFYRHKDALNGFVQTHDLADGEQVNGDSLPAQLRNIGITNIYRNGRFVYFVMPHRSFLADDATREFIWQLDWTGGGIEEILRTTKRNTYHIQHLSSAPGWYFWMHN